ncbi:hypothetical protein BS47DRAFT_634714 [Hydnum rufescens UP504]|uniref:Uncharacterized protein n=1 Tax=Hydnum rufescens UP504 TaxID=1448309 RepID=A0A9P6E263_9AGAM|nr:hypothetical protein BS47DRAFT_634714 [Hydnum rufescens UP504]
MLLIPTDVLSRTTWIDENALQPNSVATHWDWDDVRHADLYLENMESMRDRNASKLEFTEYILHEFQALGLPSSTQAYSFNATAMPQKTGVNVYASLSTPRASGSEAIVISASWRSLSFVEGSRTERNLNLRGIAILLSLARHSRSTESVLILNISYVVCLHIQGCLYGPKT